MNTEHIIILTATELSDCIAYANQLTQYLTDQHEVVAPHPGTVAIAKGEWALRQWLFTQGYEVEAVGIKKDLYIGQQLISVKGTRSSQWQTWKCAMPRSYMDFLVSKDAVVVWTVADPEVMSSRVVLKGFSRAGDIVNHGITTAHSVQLQNDSYVQSMGMLSDLVYAAFTQQRERESIEE